MFLGNSFSSHELSHFSIFYFLSFDFIFLLLPPPPCLHYWPMVLWNISEVHRLLSSSPLHLFWPFMRNQQKPLPWRGLFLFESQSVNPFLFQNLIPHTFLTQLSSKYTTDDTLTCPVIFIKILEIIWYQYLSVSPSHEIFSCEANLKMKSSKYNIGPCVHPFSLFPNHHQEWVTWLLGFTPSHLSLKRGMKATSKRRIQHSLTCNNPLIWFSYLSFNLCSFLLCRHVNYFSLTLKKWCAWF